MPILHPITPPVAALTAAMARSPLGDESRKDLRQGLEAITERIDDLQQALYAEGKRSLLVVFQARDAGGKDGCIRKVFGPLNPQGVRVTSFKAPSAEELAHDYLWRIHAAVPAMGLMGVFNRSHYEDVLVVRVHNLVPEAVWQPRYEQINAFEAMLSASGVTLLKFYLHVSPEEQRERLLKRLDKPAKNWKFNPDDLKERALWEEYDEAYLDMLNRCSTPGAPWYLVPADDKPARDVLVAEVLLETLKRMDPKFPKADEAELEEGRRKLSGE
jgi:PPK2 family polyphosphate:nucleotide phosphotransferase